MNNFRIHGKELIFTPPKYPATEVKEILGGKLNKSTGEYSLPITAMNVLTLTDWYGADIIEDAPFQVKNLFMHEWGFTGWGIDRAEMKERAISHDRWDDLYDFQKDAVEYLTCNPHHGSLLALDPGLGKGPVSIVAMDTLQLMKVLIVAPLTLARNWLAELDAWEQYYRSWSRATRSNKDPATECVVTNHETLFEPHFYDEDGEDVVIPGGPKKQKEWIESGPQIEDKRTGKLIPARKRVVEVT